MRRWRVAEVTASPLDRALFQCWPYGDPAIGPQLNGLWVEAIDGAAFAIDLIDMQPIVVEQRIQGQNGGNR